MAYWPWRGWRPRISLGENVHEWRFGHDHDVGNSGRTHVVAPRKVIIIILLLIIVIDALRTDTERYTHGVGGVGVVEVVAYRSA